MIALLRKEISVFFSSLTGYLAIIVFLAAISLFMWVFPGNFNVIDNGYANIDTLFIIAPWVFMFLIPAVTMRSFSEEWRNGTIELLLTKPLTDWQIITAKFFAGLFIVIFSLLPTLTYYWSVKGLSLAPGIDEGATWGSYFGLLFLASGFVAIGIFASALSKNQIVAFISAVFLSFFFYVGFEQISDFFSIPGLDSIIIQLGINEHYVSMSRGVIDTRDLLYFLSLSSVFLYLTKIKLDSFKW
ncbi:gliding motility-associated ABC transporter permease subunit GldF [bacterium SCSIO 12643]|nr:gliding motility-associated ABC transporter permease subunit GldF [bacterium SCSIO 12643]